MAEILNFDVKKLVKSLVESTAQNERELYQKLMYELEIERQKIVDIRKKLTYGFIWIGVLSALLIAYAVALVILM